MELWINGEPVDMYKSTVIAQTKKVNDVAELAGPEANYTNIFKIPKTANNMRILNFMSYSGNMSDVPYQKNECTLFSSTGEHFIYKGWGTLTDYGDSFEVYIIDGILDFFKDIENKTLADDSIDLSELEHQKTVANVIGSWNEYRPYKYILADYNGDTGITNPVNGTDMPEVNIDYLVPSVRIEWLWKKIQEAFGVTFFGAIFESDDFKELYMTYPKGISISGENDHTVFLSKNYTLVSPTENSFYNAKWIATDINELRADFQQIHMQVATTATYKIRVKGTFYGYYGANLSSGDANARIKIGKNGQNASSNNDLGIPPFITLDDNILFGQEYEKESLPFSLQENDTICVVVSGADRTRSYNMLNQGPQSKIEVELIRVDPNVIDFSEAFKDFGIKEFCREILQRFGLTMYKDKYQPVYEFLTLREQLKNAPTVDWSDKLSRKLKEDYIYGSFAQRNWFRYQYNDKEGSHNDYHVDVNNRNIPDTRDAFKSKLYSPERLETVYLKENSKVYKMWDKELVENPGPNESGIKYTPLDKRYYLMRSVQRDFPIRVISKELAGQNQITNLHFRENYHMLSFGDILKEYYGSLQQILNRAMIVTAELNLSELDILNLDFKKLYYFEQFSNYFMINRVESYVPRRLTKCELVRVIFSDIADPPQAVKITKIVTEQFKATVYFEMAVYVSWVQLEWKRGTSTTWNAVNVQGGDNPFPLQLRDANTYAIRIKAGNDYSNEVQITLPSNTTITPQ